MNNFLLTAALKRLVTHGTLTAAESLGPRAPL
jgi:hypothetical protein